MIVQGVVNTIFSPAFETEPNSLSPELSCQLEKNFFRSETKMMLVVFFHLDQTRDLET